MFCPKCGAQNGDGTRFCRGCGADVGNVLAAVDGKVPDAQMPLAEKYVDLYGSGLRGVMIGVGFLIVAGLSFGISIKLAVLGLFMLAFASFFLGTGISRLAQARALKRLREPRAAEPAAPALAPGEADYIRPPRSIYTTDDLLTTPASVTEQTTTHLELNPEPETVHEPKE